ncbi:MAG: hypothetical protein ACOCWR_08790 [Oceanidesulfovibrio sp.]
MILPRVIVFNARAISRHGVATAASAMHDNLPPVRSVNPGVRLTFCAVVS